MKEEQIVGLILIIVGLYSSIRYKHNSAVSLKYRIKFDKFLTFGKASDKISKFDIIFARFMYLIVGIFFIIVGLSKLLS